MLHQLLKTFRDHPRNLEFDRWGKQKHWQQIHFLVLSGLRWHLVNDFQYSWHILWRNAQKCGNQFWFLAQNESWVHVSAFNGTIALKSHNWNRNLLLCLISSQNFPPRKRTTPTIFFLAVLAICPPVSSGEFYQFYRVSFISFIGFIGWVLLVL